MLENIFWVWGVVYKTSTPSPNPHQITPNFCRVGHVLVYTELPTPRLV